jgi:TP901 family phage tail tape measure protein
MFGRNIISLGVAVNLQNNFSSQANVVTQSMIGMNSQVTKLVANSNRMAHNGMNSIIAGAAILLPFNAALKTYAEYTHTLAQIKATGELTDRQLVTLGGRIKEVGIGSVFTIQQIAEATRELARQGMPFGTMMQSIGSISDIGQATGSSIQNTSEFMSDLMSIYPNTIKQTDRLASQIVLASNRSRSSVEELANSFHYVGASARLLNMPIEHSTALLMRLADVGLKGTIGGTTADNFLRFYARAVGKMPGAKDGKAQNALAALGLSGKDFIDASGHLMRIDEALHLMMSRVKQVKSEAQRSSLIGAIFGERGKKASLIDQPSMTPGKSMDGYIKSLTNIDPNLAKKQAWETTNNLWGDIARLKDAIFLLKVNVIEPLAPALRIVTRSLTTGLQIASAIGSSKVGSFLLGVVVVAGSALTVWGAFNLIVGKSIQLLVSSVPAWGAVRNAAVNSNRAASSSLLQLIGLQRASAGATLAQIQANRQLQYAYTSPLGIQYWRNQRGQFTRGPQTHMNTGQGLMYGALGSVGMLGGSSRLARTAVSYGSFGRTVYGLTSAAAGLVPKLLGWGFALSLAWSAIDLFRDHTNDAADAARKEALARAKVIEVIPLNRQFQLTQPEYKEVMKKPTQIIINLDGREAMRKLINEKDTETYLGLNYE